MSRVFNKLYLESFKNTLDDDDSYNINEDSDIQNTDENIDDESETQDFDETDNDNDDDDNETDDNEGDDEGDDADNDDDEDRNPDEQSLKDIRKENIKNSNLDEQDEDELDDYDNEKERELNDQMEEDELDEDELTDADIDALLGQKFPDNPNYDEKDDEIFVPPKVQMADLKNDPNLDERLQDMEINDDDDEDNLFVQGGANGERAREMTNQIEQQGDELANLLLEVPIAIITLTVETVLTIIGAILEVPINNVHDYLEPIREALRKLYSLLVPIVLLINNIIGLPFSIGVMAWSTLCNILKLFGAKISCRAQYQPSTYLIDMFNAISNINPFRFKDIFFNEEFRNQLFDAVRLYVKRIIYTFVLIIKAISIIAKIIEWIIAAIKKLIKVIEDITTKDNLLGLATVLVLLSVFYLTLYGFNRSIDVFKTIKEKFFN